MRKLFCLLGVLLFGSTAAMAATTFTVQPNSVVAGIAINVPANAKLLTVTANGGTAGKIRLFVRPDQDFSVQSSLMNQASYYSINSSGSIALSIGDYGTPALHGGNWYVALANTDSAPATISLDSVTSTSNAPNTPFIINFSAASTALEDIWGGADKLECDVTPWADATPLGSSTVGAFRKQLLQAAADKLSSQIHSPVPVRIQACWKDFDDSGEHAGSYTLAAATGIYSFYNSPGLPNQNMWYAQAPSARLGGTRACSLDASIDCSIPDIIVWFNKADVAKESYDDATDEPLIISVTMHEITHGLGFLSSMTISNPDKCSDTPPPTGTDCNQIGNFWNDRNDAYTANVAYLKADPAHPLSTRTVVPMADLSKDDRKAAITSNKYLVWNDPLLAQSDDNILRNNTAPSNLVELHAPGTIQPGSTLSHLGPVHVGQLMTAVIQGNYPDTLGMAEPMLERVGWNTGPATHIVDAGPPLTGNWYDPAHSGHGIDFEKIVDDPAGDQYAVIFYSYDGSAQAEYFYAGGRLRDGRFEDPATAGQPAPMGRPVYDPVNHKATYPGAHGTLGIDFSAAAANDPACAGNTQTTKAVLSWSMDGESGKWCISPLANPDKRPDAATDLTGLWNAGSSDSGWGMSILETREDSGLRLNPLLLFYYGTDNQPHWAQADVVNYQPVQTVNLYRIQGYCRTCSKQPTTHDVIGTLTLNLGNPENTETPSGNNRMSININGGGTLKFQRTNVPVRTYSLPLGQ
ncbi:MAG TPA: hypothetical protein VFN09_01620 [Rhodanobacteraceae bacterium]|nr:hypothetical protein [Rhodanobacteraceae bacterium]